MNSLQLSSTHLPLANLYRHSHEAGDRLAIVAGDTLLSYQQLLGRVIETAAVLTEKNVSRGTRVALLAENSIDYVVTMFAVSYLGAITVPLNFRLSVGEIDQIVADCRPECIISDSTYEKVAGQIRSDAQLVAFDDISGAVASPASLDKVAANGPVVCDLGDDQAILYTSGTTGLPKGVVLTYSNFLTSTMRSGASWEYRVDGDTVLLASPIFHVAAFSIVLNNIAHGATTIIAESSQFSAAKTLDVMQEFGVSQTLMVPQQWQQIVEEQKREPRDLKLRVYIWGASPASEHLLLSLREAFPQAKSHATFGQTETTGCGVALGHEESLLKLGSVGLPDRNMAVRIVNDKFQDVERGQVGEILYRGPAVMQRFWNNEEATTAAFYDGWFRSGDLVRQDDDGYIYVVDRLKDMIISGGENIYSAELENTLAGHPGIQEIAVVGRPDEKWGEVPVAVIVPKDPNNPPNLASIREFCAPLLASYKHPKDVEYMSSFPRSGTGKVQKLSIREQFTGF